MAIEKMSMGVKKHAEALLLGSNVTISSQRHVQLYVETI